MDWAGFGKRYGLRMSTTGTSNVMEAGLGYLRGEDPRYRRAAGEPFRGRVVHIIKGTFYTTNADGAERLAYARFGAYAGSNFLSNTWRPDSRTGPGNTCVRIGFSFLNKMASNAFEEFWPDVKRRLRKR